MSHLHFPDGVLPPYLWVSGLAVTAVLTALIIYGAGKQEQIKKLPLVGILVAIMLIAMSIPLGPYHLNLTVLSGIILGPALAFLAVFTVNLFLSFMGHGGITVVGLNTLVIGLEALLGFLGFTLLKSFLRPTGAAAVTTFFALALSVVFAFGIVTASQLSYHDIMQAVGGEQVECTHPGHDHSHSQGGGPLLDALKENTPVGFMGVMSAAALPGILIESFVVAFIIGYLARVRPGLF
ncbi:MAG: energy-coupling factor ABC transporter permease [Candidatus Contubernalis sp.]|nr:energy-coupling factor ABC transporter permease [Candidatus Contubernalis sp.]